MTSIPWKKFPALLGLIALTACAGPRLEVATAPSQPSVTLSDASTSIHLTILPNTWSGYPSDLNRSYTPVEIKIQNDRTEEILLRYGDFLGLDEASNQYRAVPPAEVAQALFGSRLPSGDPGWGYAGLGPARWLVAGLAWALVAWSLVLWILVPVLLLLLPGSILLRVSLQVAPGSRL